MFKLWLILEIINLVKVKDVEMLLYILCVILDWIWVSD